MSAKDNVPLTLQNVNSYFMNLFLTNEIPHFFADENMRC
jgi:hypothetical protein